MPELPEVETVRRGMVDAMTGKSVSKLAVNRYDLRAGIPQKISEIVEGQVIKTLERRGKYIAIHLSNEKTIILHLGMSGRIRIYPFLHAYEGKKHDHVVFYLQDGAVIAFEDPRRFGMFYAVDTQDWQRRKPFCAMGPEPLGNAWSGQNLFAQMVKKKSPIKAALLDQSVVSGLGNIYVCEALFRAKISPLRLSNRVSRDDSELLVRHVRDVLNEAIAAGGSSLKDYARTDGSLGYFQHGFDVYDREGHHCAHGCAETVNRIVQSGRSTFYCPACQV